MNYIKEAEIYLKEYYDFSKSLGNIILELDSIEKEMTSIKSMNYSDVPASGSVNPDDRLVNLIFKKQVKQEAYEMTSSKINLIDSILESMGEDGVLLRRLYIDGDIHFKIYNDLGLSERSFYRRKCEAIRKFAIQLFGIKAVV